MARGALQVVGHGPVVLVAELVLDQLRHDRAHAAELGVPERVARAGVGLDNVDVAAATQAGVMVVNAPTSVPALASVSSMVPPHSPVRIFGR